MKKTTKLVIAIALIITAIIYVAPYTIWEQCEICGAQRIERGIARTKIQSWSQDEFDEYGTYAQWKELHGTISCSHRFSEVKHKTPKMTLEQLNEE